MDVSVIIVNWNTCDLLDACLESAYAQAGELAFEVIVVDNASTDGSREMIRKNFPSARLVVNRDNRGFAAANNQGLAIARGRYVLLLNSDTLILDGALAKTVRFADAHPEVAVVGCRVLNPDRSLQRTCFMFPSLLNLLLEAVYFNKLFSRSRVFGREMMSWWQRDDVREVEVVTGCFMLVRREAIERVGVMDERFFMYGEESDWCYRFKRAGWKNLFTPDAEIVHYGGQSSRLVRAKMLLQLRHSILHFMRKHYGEVQYRLACGLTLMFFLSRLPVWLVLGLVWPAKRLVALERARAYGAGTMQIFRRILAPQLSDR